MIFDTHYQRPIAFTSSGGLSESLPEMNAMLLKRDSELQIGDLELVFGPFLRGGTYSERVYFLPRAFNLIEQHAEEALDLTSGVVQFVGEHCEELKRDNLWDACMLRVQHCFREWTRTFQVVHLDEVAMTAMGSSRHHEDIVVNSHAMIRLLAALAEYKDLSSVGELLVSALSALPGTMPRSAWFLEYARMCVLGRVRMKSQIIVSLISDRERRRAHAAVVRANGEDIKNSYWRATLTLLDCDSRQ